MPFGFAPLDLEPTLSTKMVSAAMGACVADLFTFPLDTAKVRLQIQGETSSATTVPRYRGLFGTLRLIGAEEGVRGLYGGLAAGLQRQCCFASLRIGLYQPGKSFIANITQLSENNVLVRILAGASVGGFAVMVAQPTDVVKVRMQAQGAAGKNVPKRYNSSLAAYRHIVTHEGVKGLWKGLMPNVMRNSIINACELVSYDVFKTQLITRGLLTDNMPCHLLSASGAGFVATVVGAPVDLVKTRFMNSKPGTYHGVIDCALQVARQGGPLTFYNGFVPAFMRLACWNACMFVTFEQFVRAFGHASQMLSNSNSMPVVLAATVPTVNCRN